ncbi:MAG: class I SAM-dependent methyltransferase [Bacteroidales bacterium]|jgi:ubiquinone/menaquinone biosynthesis C-methylase UbiE|nr:class I SAM-dependent methyltransferase [Bacteroidales bacterium]
MVEKKFNPEKLAMLNNPERLRLFPITRVVESTKLHRPTHIIDVGAGTGLFSVACAEQFPHARISACDISPAMIAWITENIVSQHSSIVPVHTQESNIPLESESADLLFTVNVHHEFEQPLKNLAEFNRLLIPGGYLVVSDWRKGNSERGPDVSIRYTVEQLADELKHTGFSIHEIFPEVEDNFMLIARKV